MVGETEDNWQRLRREDASSLAPDSVTIYQMELPFNTTINRDLLRRAPASSSRRWPTGRPSGAGSSEAFAALEAAGYHVGSAYTAVQGPARDAASSTATACGRAPTWSAWASPRSATSTACTSRTSTPWETYGATIGRGELPAEPRATGRPPRSGLIRELVLQLKLGRVRPRTSATSTAWTCSSGSPSRSPRCAAEGYLARPTANRGADARGAAAGRRTPAGSSCPSMRASATTCKSRAVGTSGHHRSTAVPLRAGRCLPARRRLCPGGCRAAGAARDRPDDIPPPYRSLLVHERDMTLTLERHFGGRVSLARALDLPQAAVYYPPCAAVAGVLGPAGRDGRDSHRPASSGRGPRADTASNDVRWDGCFATVASTTKVGHGLPGRQPNSRDDGASSGCGSRGRSTAGRTEMMHRRRKSRRHRRDPAPSDARASSVVQAVCGVLRDERGSRGLRAGLPLPRGSGARAAARGWGEHWPAGREHRLAACSRRRSRSPRSALRRRVRSLDSESPRSTSEPPTCACCRAPAPPPARRALRELLNEPMRGRSRGRTRPEERAPRPALAARCRGRGSRGAARPSSWPKRLLHAQARRGRRASRVAALSARSDAAAGDDQAGADRRSAAGPAVGHESHRAARALHALPPDVIDHRKPVALARHERELAVDARVLEGRVRRREGRCRRPRSSFRSPSDRSSASGRRSKPAARSARTAFPPAACRARRGCADRDAEADGRAAARRPTRCACSKCRARWSEGRSRREPGAGR